VINNFSYSWPAHDLKAGVDVSFIRAPSFFPRNRDGTFTFATDAPFDANDLTTYPTQFTQSIADPDVPLPDDLYSFFVQDSWRAGTRLTLNFGIRYDRETSFSKINGVPDDTNNWAPRVGFVWDPTGAGRTVVRGGAGIYIDQTFLNPPLNVALAQRARDITIVNPGYPDPFSRGTVLLPSISVASAHMRTPETRSISLGIKRELIPGLAVSLDGVTSRGYSQYNNRDVNPPDPMTRVRPNSQYLRITQYETEGRSWYSALLASVERRPGRAPGFGASYTLSRTVRTVEGFLFLAQDQNNLDAEKGLGENHRRHQIAAHTTWSLPGRFPARPSAAGAIGAAVHDYDRRRQQPRHQHQRSPRSRGARWRSAQRVDLFRRVHRPRGKSRAEQRHRRPVHDDRHARLEIRTPAAAAHRGIHRGIQRHEPRQFRPADRQPAVVVVRPADPDPGNAATGGDRRAIRFLMLALVQPDHVALGIGDARVGAHSRDWRVRRHDLAASTFHLLDSRAH
jgi:hypothetical protein